MKKIIIAICLIVLSGCAIDAKKGNDGIKRIGNYTIQIIDSCEYVEFYDNENFNSAVYGITHKGNCKYCTKRKGIKP